MNNTCIKNDFPIFQMQHKQPFVYLDSAATSQKPQAMIDALCSFYSSEYAPVHRSLYPLGESATQNYENSRIKTASFINAQPHEIIFTKGTTESINFIANTWGIQNLHQGDEILLTEVEHHSNLIPWQQLAQKTGAILRFIPLDTKTYQLQHEKNLISNKTKLMAVTMSSNVLGTVWAPGRLEELIAHAHKQGARVLIDAAQAAAHAPLDVKQLEPDFLAFSAHKAYGPTGLGLMYIKEDLHKTIQPYQVGGSMIYEASYESATWAQSPQKFEAGTPPVAAAISWGATLSYLNSYNRKKIQQKSTDLCNRFIDQIKHLKEVTVFCNQAYDIPKFVIPFKVANIHAHDIAGYLGTYNIAVRAGHFCAQPLLNRLGEQSLVRMSVGIYTTEEDIDSCITHVKNALTYFKEL